MSLYLGSEINGYQKRVKIFLEKVPKLSKKIAVLIINQKEI